jgi:CO/xanthine dehydrogenase FAD-binding subunit
MYHAPTDLNDALQIMSSGAGKVIAGGTDVYPAAQHGKTAPYYLDVTRIAGLNAITQGTTGFQIGAAVSWAQIIKADLPPAFDALKQAAREVGSVQIQNAATLAGNLCNASPAADGVPPLLALDASVEVVSAARGARVLRLSDFVKGVRRTALAPDELLTAILVPPVPAGMGSAFEKLGSRRYLVISITMTAALVSCDDEGNIAQARVAVGACAPVAKRLPALEADLIGQHPSNVRIDPAYLTALAPIDDVRGSGAFRLDVVATQCARAIRKAAGHE